MEMLSPDVPSPSFDPGQLLAARITAEQWSVVLAVLNEHPMPHRVINPIIGTLMQQLRAPGARPMSTEDMADQLGRGVTDP